MLGISLLTVFVGGTLFGFPLLASKIQLMRLGLIFNLYYILLIPQVIKKIETSMKSTYKVFWVFLGLFLWVYLPDWSVELYARLVNVAWPLYFVLEAFYIVLLVTLLGDWIVDWTQLREQIEQRGESLGEPETILLSLSSFCYLIFSGFVVRSWSASASPTSFLSFNVFGIGCAIISTGTVLLLPNSTILEAALFAPAQGFIIWAGTAASRSLQLKSFVEMDISAVWGPLAQLTVVMFVLLTLPLVMEWARKRFSQEETPNQEVFDGRVTEASKIQKTLEWRPNEKGDKPRVNNESIVWSIMTVLALSVISKLGLDDLTGTSSFRIIELLISTGLFVGNAILDN